MHPRLRAAETLNLIESYVHPEYGPTIRNVYCSSYGPKNRSAMPKGSIELYGIRIGAKVVMWYFLKAMYLLCIYVEPSGMHGPKNASTYLYIYICVYIYIYMCIYMYIYIYTYMHIHICTYIYAHTYVYIHMHMYISMYTNIIWMYKPKYVHLYIYIYVYI